jgi:hypothetical protein
MLSTIIIFYLNLLNILLEISYYSVIISSKKKRVTTMKEQKVENVIHKVDYSEINELPNKIYRITTYSKGKIYNIKIDKATNVEIYNILKDNMIFKKLIDEDYEKIKNINITVEENEETISLECFIKKMEEYAKVYDFLTEKGKKELSPLEFILVAYDFIKRRDYNYVSANNGEDKYFSKISPLGNSPLVCVGYAKIFNQLLRMNGINAMEYGFKYKNPNTGEIEGHDVSLVFVKDPKYVLNGLYFFDVSGDHFKKTYTFNKNNELKVERGEWYNLANHDRFLLSFNQFKNKYPDISEDSFNMYLYYDEDKIEDIIKLKTELSKRNNVTKRCIPQKYDLIDRFEEVDHLLFNDKNKIGVNNNMLQNELDVFYYTSIIKNWFGRTILGDNPEFYKAIKYVYPTESPSFYTRCIRTKGETNNTFSATLGMILCNNNEERKVKSLCLTKKDAV